MAAQYTPHALDRSDSMEPLPRRRSWGRRLTRTTIAKVAAEAGVGVGTVSRVLNGSPSVSEDTRRRVLEAIAVLDYQPSAVARALSTGRTHAIAVVAPFFTQPSVIERLRGVSQM